LKILQGLEEKTFSFFENLKNKKFKLLYLLGSDNLEFQKNNEFVVYQGSHGDRGAEVADIILPSSTYTEQNGLYENLEGRIQECKKASYPIGEALEDWKIFNRILKKLDIQDKLSTFDDLRTEIFKTVPNFSKINELPKKTPAKKNQTETNFFSEKIFIKELDYYYTNSISRSSKTMSECRQIRQKIKKNGTNN
jgi:NADH-quinone oxidoreductase subunit G